MISRFSPGAAFKILRMNVRYLAAFNGGSVANWSFAPMYGGRRSGRPRSSAARVQLLRVQRLQRTRSGGFSMRECGSVSNRGARCGSSFSFLPRPGVCESNSSAMEISGDEERFHSTREAFEGRHSMIWPSEANARARVTYIVPRACMKRRCWDECSAV